MVERRPVSVLVDSGSAISSVRSSLVSACGFSRQAASRMLRVLYGDNKASAISSHLSSIPLSFGSYSHPSLPLRVMPSQLYDVILGFNWLRAVKAQADFDTSTLRIPGFSPITARSEILQGPRVSLSVLPPPPPSVDPDEAQRKVDMQRLLSLYPVLQEPVVGGQSQVRTRHQIRVSDSLPIRVPIRRRSPKEKREISAAVKDMLQQNVIRPSRSPWASEPHIVDKSDGGRRFTVDYRPLNGVTIPDSYPMKRIDDLVDRLGGSRWFTALDLASGYWQIPMDPADAEKTAFRTPNGLYEFVVMPFGLTNAPATFQRLMDEVVQGLEEFAGVYLDDLLIHTTGSWEEHLEHVRLVLERLQQYHLKLKLSKCTFGATSVKYLGVVISRDGVHVDTEKVKAVQEFPEPTNLVELQRFLGKVTYLGQFIPRLSDHTQPLRALLRAPVFEWTDECREAFKKLCSLLSTAPVLRYPDFSRPFILRTDASDVGLGVALMQEDPATGRRHPIAYGSRSLTAAEVNYSATDKECLAVVWGFAKFHAYLHGSFTHVECDHVAVNSVLKKKQLAGRHARWALAVQDYRFDVRYRSGTSMVDVDALSRAPVAALDVVPPLPALEPGAPLPDREEVRRFQREDLWSSKVLQALESGQVVGDDDFKDLVSRYRLEDGLLYFSEGDNLRLVIPSIFIPVYLRAFHDDPVAGHLGFHKVLDKLRARFYWPHMRKDLHLYLQSCHLCQARHAHSTPPSGSLQSIQVHRPFELVAFDLIGPFPVTASGNQYAIVLSDYLTRWVEVCPLPAATASHVADFLYSHVILRHGCPERVLSDNGTHFTSEVIKVLVAKLQIRHSFTTAYHPETDGLVERLNRTFKNMLSKYINFQQTDWDQYLQFIRFAYVSSVQQSLQVSPFRALYGRDPVFPAQVGFPMFDPVTADAKVWSRYLDHTLPLIRTAAAENLAHAQAIQHKHYNLRHAPVPIFSPGDLVLVWFPALRRRGVASKLLMKWQGPFRVVKKCGPQVYSVTRDGVTQEKVHVKRLTRYFTRPIRLLAEGGVM